MHLDGHCGGGGVVLGTQRPQIFSYVLQLGSHISDLMAVLHFGGHFGGGGVVFGGGLYFGVHSPHILL